MPNSQQHPSGLSGETVVVIVLVLVGMVGGIVLWKLSAPPVLVAVLTALGISSAIYRFLGGVEGAALTVGSLKLAGAAAVFMGITYFINAKLTEQVPISPSLGEWVAIDRTSGKPVTVTISGVEHKPTGVSEALRRVQLEGELSENGLLVRPKGDPSFPLGVMDITALRAIHLFDAVGRPGDLRFSGELQAGGRFDLRPTYPFELRVTSLDDDLNNFTMVDDQGTPVLEIGLRNKSGFVFEHDGDHFLVFIVRANHEGDNPYAVFGFASLLVTLGGALVK